MLLSKNKVWSGWIWHRKNFFQNDIFLRSKYRYFSKKPSAFFTSIMVGFQKFGAAQKHVGGILLLSKKKLFLFLFFHFSSLLRCFCWCCCLLRSRGFRFHSFNNGSPARFRRRFPYSFLCCRFSTGRWLTPTYPSCSFLCIFFLARRKRWMNSMFGKSVLPGSVFFDNVA